MKFTKFAFSLLASTALAQNLLEAQKLIETSNVKTPMVDMPMFKAAISIDSVDPKCQDYITKNQDCINDLTGAFTVTSACKIYENENCKDFLADIYKNQSDCSGEPVMEASILTLRYGYVGSCIKDEEGNSCPFTKINTTGVQTISDEEVVKQSCKSPNCERQLKAFMDMIPKMVEIGKENGGDTSSISKLEKAHDKLKDVIDDKCSSGASKINVSLVSVALLLITYLL